MVAIMEIRPCFNSTDRRRLKEATSPSEVKPTGSQKPTGACTPSSFSKASQYDPDLIAKSPNGFPVRPSCHVTCALSLQRLSLQISSQCSADAHSAHSTVQRFHEQQNLHHFKYTEHHTTKNVKCGKQIK